MFPKRLGFKNSLLNGPNLLQLESIIHFLYQTAKQAFGGRDVSPIPFVFILISFVYVQHITTSRRQWNTSDCSYLINIALNVCNVELT